MILPNPDPWFSPRTCHHLALSAAIQQTAELMGKPRRSAQDDGEMVRVARCAHECAGLLDRHERTPDVRVRTGLLLAHVLLLAGRYHESAELARHLQRYGRGSAWAAEIAVRAAQIGARAWLHLEHHDHAEHLLTLARTVIETVDDIHTRQRLLLLLATDSPVSSMPIPS